MKLAKSIKNKLKIINTKNINILLFLITILLCLSATAVVFSVKNIINPNSIKKQESELLAKQQALSKQISLMNHELSELAFDINVDYDNYVEKLFLYNQFQKCYMTMQKSNASGVFFKLNNDDNDGFYIHNNASSFISDTKEDITLLIGPSDLAKANDISLDTEWSTDFFANENKELFYEKLLKYGELDKDAPLSSMFYFAIFDKSNDNKVIVLSVPLISDDGKVYGVCGLELSYDFILEHLPNAENSRYYFMLTKPIEDKTYDYENSVFLDKKDGGFIENKKVTKLKRNTNHYKGKIGDETIYTLLNEIKIYPKNNISENKGWVIMAYSYKQDKSQLALLFTVLSFVITGVLFYIFCCIKIRFHKINIKSKFNNKITNDNSNNNKEDIVLFESRLNSLTKTEKTILKMHIDGFSTQDILQTRKITPNTLKSHNNKIYSKMDVKNKSQLIAYYFKMKP